MLLEYLRHGKSKRQKGKLKQQKRTHTFFGIKGNISLDSKSNLFSNMLAYF